MISHLILHLYGLYLILINEVFCWSHLVLEAGLVSKLNLLLLPTIRFEANLLHACLVDSISIVIEVLRILISLACYIIANIIVAILSAMSTLHASPSLLSLVVAGDAEWQVHIGLLATIIRSSVWIHVCRALGLLLESVVDLLYGHCRGLVGWRHHCSLLVFHL